MHNASQRQCLTAGVMGVISMLQTAGGIGSTGFSASGASEPATAARGEKITRRLSGLSGELSEGKKRPETTANTGVSGKIKGEGQPPRRRSPSPFYALFYAK